jgi:hypothetical protein
MDKTYVLITGSGNTSRANVEALIEDYFYAKGKECYLVLAFEKMPSQGQVFAAQYAKDKGKDILIFCKEGANPGAIPTASVSFSEHPITDAIDLSETVMLLWDDTDPACLVAVTYCDASGKKAYNLCEGLTLINKPELPVKVEEAPIEISVVAPVTDGLSEALKAEITESVMLAVKSALKNALEKA